MDSNDLVYLGLGMRRPVHSCTLAAMVPEHEFTKKKREFQGLETIVGYLYGALPQKSPGLNFF